MVLAKPGFQFSRSPLRLIVLATLLLLQPWSPDTDAQRRTTRRRPPGKSKPTVRDVNFQHQHHRKDRSGKEISCANCHTITSVEAPDVIAAATDTRVKGFPYHDSCLECHRRTPPQFFRSATPIICNLCHTRSSPRLTAKEMLMFPKPGNIRPHELVGYFSHGSREHRNAVKDCTTCHSKDERPAVVIVAAAAKDFVPAEGTFRKLPRGHATCFANCHWDKDKPTKDQCEGCHFPQAVLADKKRDARSPLAAAWFIGWPSDWPSRLSLKFSHESKNHRESDNPELTCTTCHDSIKRSDKLEIPDVPVASCAAAGCHFERASRTSIRKEMLAEEEDIAEARDNDAASKTGQNTCLGCHTAAIGSSPPPCSHFRLFGEKYFDSTAYPKAATQLLARCPK